MQGSNGATRAFDVIALDADDTLWHNERLFESTHERFCDLLSDYHNREWIEERLNATEARNVQQFGYGIKGFVLSMIETAIELTESRVTGSEIQQIINWGHEMIGAPVELLNGVEETVKTLAKDYPLMLLTKGDLFNQETKLARSRLGEFFSAIEIVSEKDSRTYRAVMTRHNIAPDRFLMVGNSLRSDILPVLEAGGTAVYIPYHTTWVLERVSDEDLHGKQFAQLEQIGELPEWVERQARTRTFQK